MAAKPSGFSKTLYGWGDLDARKLIAPPEKLRLLPAPTGD
jgi:hypothetical protein